MATPLITLCPGVPVKKDSAPYATVYEMHHCQGCRDAAPPVLTEEEQELIGWWRTLVDGHDDADACPEPLQCQVAREALAIIDRLTTGGTGGSRG